MGEFFRGWRRKLGLLTLVMASVFAGGWVRSLTIRDTVDFPHWNKHYEQLHIIFDNPSGIVSDNQSISWQIECVDLYFDLSDDWVRWRSTNKPSDRDFSFDYVQDERFCGFGRREQGAGIGKYRRIRYHVPYWSIVISLTLLSAYLLLTKPRSLKTNKSD